VEQLGGHGELPGPGGGARLGGRTAGGRRGGSVARRACEADRCGSFVHRDRCHRRHAAAPAPAGGHGARQPRHRPRRRARRDPAAGAERVAVASRPGADQPRRHRRADGGRRDLHRHARHRAALRRPGDPGAGAATGARRRLAAQCRRRRRPRPVRRRPRRVGRARRDRRRHDPVRAGVRARGGRGPRLARRGAGRPRRPRRRQRPLRVLLVPAHPPRADQAQQPRAARHTGAAARAGAVLGGRRPAVQHRLRARQPADHARPGAGADREPGRGPRPQPA